LQGILIDALPILKTMKVLIDGITKDLHYSIAAKLLKTGQATLIEVEAVEIEEKKETKYEKKIVKNLGKKKNGKSNR